MIDIHRTKSGLPQVDQALLRKAMASVLAHLKKSQMDVTLRLTDDAEMRALNQSYRGIAKTTDVLSFNQDHLDPETGRQYLGDIVISLEQADRQAASHAHTLSEECALLAIHGTLHLLGYDHADPSDKQVMWKLQETLHQAAVADQKEDPS